MQTVGVNLICKIGSSYPDTAPEIEIEITDGLLPAQARELQQLANETAEANVGMPMGYTIAEAIREWLVENNISNTDGSMHANMLRRMDEKSKQTRKEVAIQEVCDNCIYSVMCPIHYGMTSTSTLHYRLIVVQL
jgi:RWD domain